MYAVSWAYIGLMGYARLVMGQHYLGDVVAGAAIVALLFYRIRRRPWYKAAMEKTLRGDTEGALFHLQL